MEQENIHQLLEQVEDQFATLYETVAQLQKELRVLMDENNKLRLMNHTLSQQLTNFSLEKQPQERPKKSSAHPTLRTFYEEGIHVCHTAFGSRRSQEECMFCQSVLDILEEGKR